MAENDAPEPVADGVNAVRIELPDFEGPLDLLLHLVKKHELDIFDIPIAFITEKYLEHINLMQALNLDIAGEYLLMAATLAYLKSRELVPPTPEELAAEAAAAAEEEEVGDPRQELIRRLLEYQKYKEAAAALGARPVMGRNVWTRGARAEDVAGIPAPSEAPLAEVPVFKLIEALEKVMAKARVKLTHDVVVDRVSITDKINEIVDRLEREPTFTFASCFAFLDDRRDASPSGRKEGSVDGAEPVANLRHQIVITFLALLEMTRLKMMKLHQPADRGEIYVARGDVDLATARARVRGDDEFRG